MDHLDGNAWVFDSLVGFLHGPVWNVPLQTFIEEKSLPFEPTENGEVPDRPEYKIVHNEYRNLLLPKWFGFTFFCVISKCDIGLGAWQPSQQRVLLRRLQALLLPRDKVDVMLGSFMDDIGITADQFEAACRLSARDLAGLPAHFHRRLFEQIWAANDYDMFVKMMTHKNVELQLQALELIERRFGTMPNLFSLDTNELDSSRSDGSDEWPDNDDVMTEIKKLQLEEYEPKDEIVSVPPVEVVAEKKTLLSKLHSFDKKEFKEEKHVLDEESHVAEMAAATEPPKPPPKKVEVSEEEVRARQDYLKQQRDKLLALKKQVREKRLGAAEAGTESGGGEGSHSVSRPKSARAAHAALAGATPSPAPDAMQLRRALASKLKTEVVDNH